MKKDIINLYEELEGKLSPNVTDVPSVMRAIDDTIALYNRRRNIPKYVDIAPLKVKALRDLKEQIGISPSIILRHLADYIQNAFSYYTHAFELLKIKIECIDEECQTLGRKHEELLKQRAELESEKQHLLCQMGELLAHKAEMSNTIESPAKDSRHVFGIDLGTTYSCIAYVNDFGQAEVIMNEEGQPVTPSVVAFEEGGHVIVGEAAKEMLSSDPEHVVSFIKRHMGSRDYTFEAFGTNYIPEEISAIILSKLAKDASLNLGETVKDVVITWPAYFGSSEHQATINAGKMAGLNVLAVLNEPTAAAISYGMQDDTPQTVIVYNLGGATFDVTIIKMESGLIRVVAVGGDHHLGGKNWDEAIAEYAVQQYCDKTGESCDNIYDDEEEVGDLVLKTETAKKALTTRDKATVKLKNEKIEVTRDFFDQLTVTLLDKTIEMTKETMAEAAKKGITHYDKMLLVGGSTWMKQVHDRLNREFPDIPKEFCDPNLCVAKGAALYGLNMLAFNTEEEYVNPILD